MERFGGKETKKRLLFRKLMKDFKYDFRHTLIVCPTERVNPRYVASILGRRDHQVTVNNHWVSTDSSSPIKVWGGAVAQFSYITFARVTAEDIQKQFGSLKIIFFEEVMDLLITAEALYPKKPQETTKILIRGPKSFNEYDIYVLDGKLLEFGKPKNIVLHRGITHGVIGEVEYSSQFEAYAARTAMHGMLFECLGHLEVEVEVTESGKKFDNFVKMRFREILQNVDD